MHSHGRMTLATVLMAVVAATGTHQRWTTDNGPIHTWRAGAAVPSMVVVYVHGYRDDADSAFEGHGLAKQFAESGVEALFVVPEAPQGPQQRVFWPDLERLLAEVARAHGVPKADAVLVVAHSGGTRTVKAWLSSPRVTKVVLLDGFYGDPKPFDAWLQRDVELVMVGQATYAKAEAWLRALPASSRAKVTHHAAGCSHMELVTAGKWIPRLITAPPQIPAALGAGVFGPLSSGAGPRYT